MQSDPASYVVWLGLPEPWRSDTFVAAARARGVVLTPADPFVVGRGSVPHAARLCLGAARSDEELDRGLRTVAEVLQDGRDAGPAFV